MSAFREDGGPPSQRPPSLFLEWSGGLLGTQAEAEQVKGVSDETHLGECLLGPGLFRDGYLKPGFRGDSYVI